MLVVWADEPTLLLRHHLASAGFEARAVRMHDVESDTKESRALLRSYTPDVLIYEVTRPLEASLFLLEFLRSVPAFADTPCILTREETTELDSSAIGGVVGVLTVPFDVVAARLIVANALRFRPDATA